MPTANKWEPPTNRRLGQIVIWVRKGTVPLYLRECLPTGAAWSVRDRAKDWPDRCDYYIVSALSADVEREAAHMQALPVCLPAAQGWLIRALAQRAGKGETTWICMRRRP